MSLTARTKVKNKETGMLGVVIEDFYKICHANEVVVIYEGEIFGDMENIDCLENLGPENARADLRKCGFGQGDKCCIFLTTLGTTSNNPNDCECQRHGPLRNEIISNLINNNKISKRWPTEPCPRCQIFDRENKKPST